MQVLSVYNQKFALIYENWKPCPIIINHVSRNCNSWIVEITKTRYQILRLFTTCPTSYLLTGWKIIDSQNDDASNVKVLNIHGVSYSFIRSFGTTTNLNYNQNIIKSSSKISKNELSLVAYQRETNCTVLQESLHCNIGICCP